MNQIRILPDRWSPYLLSVLRIITAFTFITHGTMKLFAFPAMQAGQKPVELATIYGLAGIIEVVGGTLLLVGLFTPIVAFILSGEMAVAYFKAHAPNGFWPILNRGEVVVVFCFIFLYVAAAGPGPWSLDALRQRRDSGR